MQLILPFVADIYRAHSLLESISKRPGIGLDVRLEMSVCSLLLGNAPGVDDPLQGRWNELGGDEARVSEALDGLAGSAVEVMVSYWTLHSNKITSFVSL